MGRILVRRTRHKLLHDPTRVVAKHFRPGEEGLPDGSRVNSIVERILGLSEEQVAEALEHAFERYSARHKGLREILLRHFKAVQHYLPVELELGKEQRLLIGAYLTREYSFEAAALCNPSIVPAPDQSGLEDGELRFVLSLRAIGEGHISGIEFRVGVIDRESNIRFDPLTPFAVTGQRRPPEYNKKYFEAKLAELHIGKSNEVLSMVLEELDDQFSKKDLESALASLDNKGVARSIAYETRRIIHWLAESNYLLSFPADSEICERIILPGGPTESGGMEDARFVRFEDEHGEVMYYATYTAYDGFEILPQLISTNDFRLFRMTTLRGACAQNKGMALFPRKVNGHYAMLARIDRENIQLMLSKRLRDWSTSHLLRTPDLVWNLIQLGNCGSPIETEHGWLVLTHGVGLLREYAIGAMLLDLEDPSRVIGHLREPLMVPNEAEREGYVPNVLYTCGCLHHADNLLIPYGFSDAGTAFAVVSMEDLLRELRA